MPADLIRSTVAVRAAVKFAPAGGPKNCCYKVYTLCKHLWAKIAVQALARQQISGLRQRPTFFHASSRVLTLRLAIAVGLTAQPRPADLAPRVLCCVRRVPPTAWLCCMTPVLAIMAGRCRWSGWSAVAP